MRFIRKAGRIIPIKSAYKAILHSERADKLTERVGAISSKFLGKGKGKASLNAMNTLKRASNLAGHHEAMANKLVKGVGNSNLFKAIAIRAVRTIKRG